MPESMIIGGICTVVGIALGLGVFKLLQMLQLAKARTSADQVIREAEQKAQQSIQEAELKAKNEFFKRREEFEKSLEQTREEIRNQEKRLQKREDSLDQKLDLLDRKEKQISKLEGDLQRRQSQLDQLNKEAQSYVERQKAELYRVTNIKPDEARAMLLQKIESEMQTDVSKIVAERTAKAREEADVQAKHIICTAIQRIAGGHTADVTVSSVELPNDEVKGKIIGREGRNIRAFEKATGVDVIVDDTPGVIVVSAFDQVRREVARRSMLKLIEDGRIHPARIEEIVAQMEKEVESHIYEMAKQALAECDIHNVHRKIQYLLGRLHYRTSYGQNVLRHSIEVAHLCAAMAGEMGLDVKLARRGGLLHDIGKAIDHEEEGGHPAIGADWARRYNESREVIDAIAHHHEDQAMETVYSALASAADAISSARPGARVESLDRYLKRLGQLEEIARSFEGVTNCYAIQAGREIRVLVDSSKITDDTGAKICRDIAKRIEREMTYPGEVKVTLLRETRAVEYAR